ncbi:MAG: hypothetical protein K6G08_05165 [Prevotella sp.]|nr:hypothetical protein [Prevotella sp.]
MDNFEEQLREDLHQFLQSMKEVDERLPECSDVEEKWEQIAKAYIPDGIKEFNDFPSASLGWMMYIGMAVAKMWDTEWEVTEQREQSGACSDSAESRRNSTEGQIYSKIEDLYAYMRDKRGYDSMDEYIREDVLLLRGVDYSVLEKLVGECASRVYNALRHQNIEPGTKEAFNAYVSCLHQLYLFGAAMQLNRMGSTSMQAG